MVSYINKVNQTLGHLRDKIIGNYYQPTKDIVLITGGASGLGKELVTMFHDHKTTTIVLDMKKVNDDDQLDNVYYYQCDVGNRQQIGDIYSQIKRDIGTVTILINNAAITDGKPLMDLTFDDIEHVIHTNLLSSFYTIKTFLPDMLAIKKGYIVTIASVLGYMSPARLSAYGASKSGLIALHESLTYELGPPSLNLTGVKTLLLCPGQLKTGMFSSITTPSSLLAPELDPKYVGEKLIHYITMGRRGEVKLPFYGKVLPIFRSLPWPIVEVIRTISGIDKSMTSFKSSPKVDQIKQT